MSSDARAMSQTREYALLDLAYDAVFEWDFDTDRIIFWNTGAERLYGWSREEAVGQPSHELLHTIFPDALAVIKEDVARRGEWEGELIHTARDGRIIRVLSRWAAYAEPGSPLSILEINDDITSDYEAESYRARLAAIVESSQDAIIGKDLNGIITNWNPAAEKLYGYRVEEVLGKSIAILAPPERLAEIDDIMARVRRGEAVKPYDTERVRKDGTRVHVSISVSPIVNGARKVIGAATIARDISARVLADVEWAQLLAREQQARTAAEAAERRLAFLADASNILGATLDYETILTSLAQLVVPHTADWCGVQIVERGEVQRLVTRHRDPEKVALVRALEERYPPSEAAAGGAYGVLRSGRSVLISDVTEDMLVRAARDEEHLTLLRTLDLRSFMAVPLHVGGEVFGLISFAQAESDRRFSPADLSLMDELARRAGMAIENARLYDEVQQAIQARDEFLSISSHELKTPLTALQLQTQLLRRLHPDAPAEEERILQSMSRQIKRLARLTSDLLDVSRISSGQFSLERRPVDLADLLADVVDRFEEEAAAAGSSLSLTAPAGIIGRWDRHRLDQVFSNVLANAIKYGGGGPIGLGAEADEESATVIVKDAGVGIKPEDIPHIFDRFARMETTEKTGGLGLGLYIVRQIMDAHGGTIEVESEPGKGTSFRLTLPR
ncbi:MAG TPA: PAS domain S-box protein [Chloroflexota bacterium]|nr:PAS domain S-box protein [Chloroflexota bacterium]